MRETPHAIRLIVLMMDDNLSLIKAAAGLGPQYARQNDSRCQQSILARGVRTMEAPYFDRSCW